MKYISTLCFLLLPLFSSANHSFVGGELSYQDLGNGKYLVYFSGYRNCSSLPLSSGIVNVSSGTTSFNLTLTQSSTTDVTAEVMQCSRIMGTSCTGTGTIGYQKIVFWDTLDISGYQSCEWALRLGYSATRDVTTGGSGSDFGFHAMLNKCAANNSLVFTSYPKLAVFASTSTSEHLNFTAGDTTTSSSSDSISYEFLNPLTSSGNQVNYSGAFNYYRPLTFFGFPNHNLNFPAGIQLTNSGDMYFRPTSQGEKFGLCVKVNRWRQVNGQMTKIGYVVRDYESEVLASINNSAPGIQLATSSGLPSSILAIPGTNEQISILTTDQNSADTTRIIYWSVPGYGTFNKAQYGNSDSAVIVLTPSLSDTTGLSPDTIYIKAEDDRCPGQKVTSQSILVYVAPKPNLSLSLDSTCLNWTLNKTLSRTTTYTGPLQSFWEVKDSNGTALTFADKYADQLQLGPGPYSVKVRYGYQGSIYFSEDFTLNNLENYRNFGYQLKTRDTICNGQDGVFNLSYTGDSNAFVPTWSILNDSTNNNFSGSSSGLIVPAAGYLNSTKYLFQIKDNQSCVYVSDTLELEIRNPFTFTLLDSVGFCDGDSSLLNENYLSEYSYLWNTNDTVSSIWVKSTGQYTLSVSSQYCPVETKSVSVVTSNAPVLSPMHDTVICIPGSIHATLLSSNGPVSFYWNGSLTPQTSSYSFVVQGNYFMDIKVIDQLGCSDSFSFILQGRSAVSPQLVQGNNPKTCPNDSVLVGVLNPVSGAGYLWSSGATGQSAYYTVGSASVKITDSIGCSAIRSFAVSNYAPSEAGFNYNRSGLNLILNPKINYPVQHFWDFGDGSSDTVSNPSHTYASGGNFTIQHTILDSNGCSYSESVTLAVLSVPGINTGRLRSYPNPFSEILNLEFDTEMENLQIEVYDAKGTLVYNWSNFGSSVKSTQIDLSGLRASGLYELRWKSDKYQGNHHIMKM